MNKISINKCVGGAWDLTTKHWIMCIFLAVAMFIYSIINGFGSTDNAIGNPSNMTPEELNRMIASMLYNSLGIGTLIAYIVMYALQAGIYKMAINGYNDQKVGLSAYNMSLMTYVKFIAASIVYGILSLVGLFFLIIPGIIIGVRLMFAPIIMLAEPETGFAEAFKKSWAMTRGNFWGLFLLGIIVCLLNIIGLVCCFVGVFFTGVMSIFMEIILYYELKDNVNDFGQPVTEI